MRLGDAIRRADVGCRTKGERLDLTKQLFHIRDHYNPAAAIVLCKSLSSCAVHDSFVVQLDVVVFSSTDKGPFAAEQQSHQSRVVSCTASSKCLGLKSLSDFPLHSKKARGKPGVIPYDKSSGGNA